MSVRNDTLNDFFISMKHLFHPIHHNYYTFASEFETRVLTQLKRKANETNEKIHSEFPKSDA